MSEVKRYYIGVYGGEAQARVCLQGIKGLIRDSEGKHFTLADDFDRVTAERDAALGREDMLREEVERQNDIAHAAKVECSKLQQRLTAADERADVLEGLLRRSMLAMSRIYEAGRDFIVGSGSDCDSVELMMENDPTAREIRAALKPADTAKCERCGCSTVETCDERGCGYLGAGNGAPE